MVGNVMFMVVMFVVGMLILFLIIDSDYEDFDDDKYVDVNIFN